MNANITLLEDRVRRVVDRLREVTRERQMLQEELEVLREKLNALGSDATWTPDPAWSTRLGEIRSTIQRAVEELRGE